MSTDFSETALTLQSVPKAVSLLIDQMAEMKAQLTYIEQQLGISVNRHRPILIDRAAEILGITVRAVHKLIRAQDIPYYQRAGNYYFFEDELIRWIEDSRVTPYYEQLKKRR